MQYQSKANTKKIITILTILLTPCSKLNLMDESDNVFIWDSKAIIDNLSESVVLRWLVVVRRVMQEKTIFYYKF